MEKFDEAEKSCDEAEKALEPMRQKTPQLYGNLMSRILWNRSDLLERRGRTEEARFAAERGLCSRERSRGESVATEDYRPVVGS